MMRGADLVFVEVIVTGIVVSDLMRRAGRAAALRAVTL